MLLSERLQRLEAFWSVSQYAQAYKLINWTLLALDYAIIDIVKSYI